MEFSREKYIVQGLLAPMAGLAIALAVLILFTVGLFQNPLTIRSPYLWGTVFCLFFIFLLLYDVIDGALKYTWALWREGEGDVQMIRGEFQRIVPVEHSPIYSKTWLLTGVMKRNKALKAVLLYVGDKELYCLSKEGLLPGRKLVLRHLPKSRVVLSWRSDLNEFFSFRYVSGA